MDPEIEIRAASSTFAALSMDEQLFVSGGKGNSAGTILWSQANISKSLRNTLFHASQKGNLDMVAIYSAMANSTTMTENEFRALIVKQVRYELSGRQRRRAERASEKKSKWVTVRGMRLDEFSRLSITDQFIHLRGFIPDGWRPLRFEVVTPPLTTRNT
jgi:hypothetical protein